MIKRFLKEKGMDNCTLEAGYAKSRCRVPHEGYAHCKGYELQAGLLESQGPHVVGKPRCTKDTH